MRAPLASPPLTADIERDLAKLERATSFDGMADAYESVCAEAKRRTVPAALAIIPGLALFGCVYLAIRALGWVQPEWWWIVFVAIPFTTMVTYFLRGSETTREEARLQKAIDKWRMQAGVNAARRQS